MSFKKHGADPELDRKPFSANEPSSFALRFIGEAFAALGIGTAVPQPEDHLRYRRSRGKPTPRKKRPNRLTVSKRVRRKHRRAA